MLRQLGSLAVHGERAERLLRSAAVPRGFASSANAGGGWFGGRTSSSANVSSADDGLNNAYATTSGGMGDPAVASSSPPMPPSADLQLLSDTTSTTVTGGFDPVGAAASMLEHAHATSGLPWWCTIACSAVAVRVFLFPVTVKQAKAGALLQSAIAKARDKDGNPPRDIKSVLAAASALRAHTTNGVSLGWLVFAPAIQLPTFVVAVLGVRRMVDSDANHEALRIGGTAWFPDLTATAVDLASATAPMGISGAILPIAVAGALFANVNNAWGTAAEKSRQALVLKLAMEWLCVPTLLVGLTLPQAVHMYWLPASLTSLAQGVLMRTAFARKALGVDPVFETSKMMAPSVGERARDGEELRANDVSGLRQPTYSVSSDEDSTAQKTVLFERDLQEHQRLALISAAQATAAGRFADAALILERNAKGFIGENDMRDADEVSSSSSSSSPYLPYAHPAVLFALGQTLGKLRRWVDAASAYELSASQETDLARKARAFAGAGVAHANLGTDQSLETATGFLKRSIELRNDDVATMLSLAAVLKKTGDLYGALAVLEQASGIAPEIRQRFLAPLQLEIERSKKRDAHKQTKGTRLGGKKEKAFGKEKRR